MLLIHENQLQEYAKQEYKIYFLLLHPHFFFLSFLHELFEVNF